MSVTLRAISVPTNANTPSVIPKPTGTVDGDLMIMQISSNGASDYIATPPAGWQMVGNSDISGVSRNTLYYKYANSEPADYTVICRTVTLVGVGIATFYDSAAGNVAIRDVQKQLNASSTNRTYPSVTPTTAADMLCCFGHHSFGGSSTPDAACAEQWDFGSSRLYFMNQALASASATGTRIATGTAGASGCVSLILTVGAEIKPSGPFWRPGEVVVISSSSAGSKAIAAPGNLAVGDMMILQVEIVTAGVTPTPPAGFTAITNGAVTGTNSLFTFYKIAVLADIGATFTVTYTGTQNISLGIAAYYSPNGLVLAIDVAQNSDNTVASTSQNFASVTTTKPISILHLAMTPGLSFQSTPAVDCFLFYDTSSTAPRVVGMFSRRYASGAQGTIQDETTSTTSKTVTIALIELPVPTDPSSLVATAISISQIDLTWNDNESTETSQEIERSLDGSTGWTLINSPATDVESYSNTGLSEHTQYFYRVRAIGPGGNSGWSNIADATTLIAAPTSLTATTFDSSQIDLSWTDNSGVEDDYRIEQSPDGVGSWVEVGSVGAGVTAYSATGLSPITPYWFRVRAKDGSDYSAYSNSATDTTDSMAQVNVTKLGALVEVDQEPMVDVTLLGAFLEIGTDSIQVTLLGALLEIEELVLAVATYFTPRVGAQNHLLLPEPVTGYALDAGNSFWSVVVPEASINLVTDPSIELIGGPVITDVDFSFAVLTNEKASRGFNSLKCLPSLGDSGTLDYQFYALETGWYTWSFDLFHHLDQTFTLEIRDSTEAVLYASASITPQVEGWQRYSLRYYEPGTLAYDTRIARLISDPTNTGNNAIYTDGWQIEHKSYPTTYLDGDMREDSFGADPYAYGWSGSAHASTSFRSDRTHNGGKLVSLFDMGFMTIAVVGLGLVDPMADIVQLSDGEGILRDNRIGPKEFSVIGKIFGKNSVELQRKRQELIDLFSVLNSRSGMVRIAYQPVNRGGQYFGKRLFMDCVFLQGLSGNFNNLYQENLELRFQLLDSRMQEEFGNAQNLVEDDHTLFETGIYSRDPHTGQWEDYLVASSSTTGGNVKCAVKLDDGSLVVGGSFTAIGGVSARRIARFDPNTGLWAEYGGGFNSTVNALAVGRGTLNGRVIAVGAFTQNGAATVTLRRAAYYNGTIFAELGSGFNDEAYDVAVHPDGRIYAVGAFTQDGLAAAIMLNFAMYEANVGGDSAWHNLITTISVAAYIRCLTVGPDLDVYLGGSFDWIESNLNVSMANVVKFDSDAEVFSSLGNGFDDVVRDVAFGTDGYLYATGEFVQDSLSLQDLRHFARFVGTTWEEVGRGEINVDMYDMAWDKRGNAYVATAQSVDGDYDSAITTVLMGWNGSTWFPMDLRATNASVPSIGKMIVTSGGNLIVPTAGATAVNIAGYNLVENLGTADARVKFFVVGNGNVHRISNWSINKHIYFKSLVLTNNETLTVDLTGSAPKAWTSTRADVLEEIALNISDLNDFRLVPGDNHITASLSGTFSENTEVTIAWINHHWSIDAASQ